MSGLKALRKIQLAKEVTPGTQISTATARLIGTATMENDQKFYRPDDLDTGRLASYEHSYIVGEQAKITFNADANYEQLGYLLGMNVIGGITGGSPTDSVYTRTYVPNMTSANAPDTYTIQYGDDTQAFISGFCYATDLEFTANAQDDKAVMMVKANIVGQNVRASTFTAAITPPATVTPVIVGTGALYIDSTWAGLGGTKISTSLIDLSYKVVPSITPVKYIDGTIYFSDRAEAKRHVEISATFAFNAGVAGYFTNFIASPSALQFVRFKFTGPLIGATAHAELDLDAAMVIDKYATLTDRSGQDTVKLTMLSQYDATSSHDFQAILKNGVATLP
jgi:hypothetical protein